MCSLQSLVSIIQTVVLTADVFQFFITKKKYAVTVRLVAKYPCIVDFGNACSARLRLWTPATDAGELRVTRGARFVARLLESSTVAVLLLRM